jgi:phosphonate transport system permease protein
MKQSSHEEKIRLLPPRFLFRLVISSGIIIGLYIFAVNITGANPIRLIRGLPIIGRMITEDLFPPAWSYLRTSLSALLETWNMALLATTLAAGISLPVSFSTTKRINTHLQFYRFSRILLNTLRTIPDVLLAILVVAFMGMGAVSGIVALTIYSTVILSKMLSETMDGLNKGPMEAVIASGGNKKQVIFYAIMPQLLPQYLSYVFYAFELNLKTSVILGFVGAGGIGQLIHRNIQFLRYERLTFVLIVLFVVISVVDGVSNWIRRSFV